MEVIGDMAQRIGIYAFTMTHNPVMGVVLGGCFYPLGERIQGGHNFIRRPESSAEGGIGLYPVPGMAKAAGLDEGPCLVYLRNGAMTPCFHRVPTSSW